MVCDVNKIDSNVTGGSYAEEECPKQLPTSGVVWYGLEPNSYKDLGATLQTVARDPINPTRQRKKGGVTDLTAQGGFNTDLTATNLKRLMQGFVFADAHERPQTQPLNGTQVAITDVTAADGIHAASGLGSFVVGDLVQTSGFGVAANNGIFTVSSAAAGLLGVTPAMTDEATPPATAKVTTVGHQFASGVVSLAYTGNQAELHGTNLDQLGLIPGEWVYVGGDATNSHFDNANGFARVKTISATVIVFDKVSWKSITPDSGAGKSVAIYFGSIIRNEPNAANIKRRTYQIERSLGHDANGPQAEYLTGAVPNQFTLNVKQADKVNCDLDFVGMDYETRDGTLGLKTGSRPSIPVEDMFNTSDDVPLVRLATVVPGDSNPQPLFAFATDLTITINNNVSANKAIGVLGAMDTTAGVFEVGGSLTAYFADVASTNAIRQNADVTLDLALVKANKGILFDVPLLTLGNGRLNVTKDQPIMIPLDTMAAESANGYTLLLQFFDYLPNLASA